MILINLKNYYSRFSSSSILLKIIHAISWTLANLCIFLITALRPLLGPDSICPFALGCTQFAIVTLQNKPLLLAIAMICKRLISCNPISMWIARKKTPINS